MPEYHSRSNRLYRRFNIPSVVPYLELCQDILIVLLCIGLLCEMLLLLQKVFVSLYPPDFTNIASDILFLLILVELFQLLIIYLRDHSISVHTAVEVGIVSALREVIVKGIVKMDYQTILSMCAFLLVMGFLLWVGDRTQNDSDKFFKHPIVKKKLVSPQSDSQE